MVAVRGRVFRNQRAALVFASCPGTIVRHGRAGKISPVDCWLARGRSPRGIIEESRAQLGGAIFPAIRVRQPYAMRRAVFFIAVIRDVELVQTGTRTAAEVTAACGGNREPEQRPRSQRRWPTQGTPAEAGTATRKCPPFCVRMGTG